MWFHVDAQPGNLLLNSSGQLGAVIDFGTSGIGGPACDTTIAWTFRSGDSQRVFRQRLPAVEMTWTRGRGKAIWPPLFSADWQLSALAGCLRCELGFRVVAGEWRVHLMGAGWSAREW